MNYKGIIFDFNGVLLWDDALHQESYVPITIRLRGSALTDEEFDKQVKGRPNKAILHYITNGALDDEESFKLGREKELLYQKLCLESPDQFKLSPGAIELLDFLVQKNIPRTIASGSDKHNMDFFQQHLDLDKWFDAKDFVYDNGIRLGKPHPDIYVEAAEKIGVMPEKCIVVEDSVSGLEAACRAGIGYIIALGPKKDHASLASRTGVCQVIESFKEFPRELF